MAKDYFQQLAKHVVAKDWVKLISAARAALLDIRAETEQLSGQEALIEQLLGAYAKYAPQQTVEPKDEGQIKLGATTSDSVNARTVKGEDGFASKERGELTRKAARSLAQRGRRSITANNV